MYEKELSPSKYQSSSNLKIIMPIIFQKLFFKNYFSQQRVVPAIT